MAPPRVPHFDRIQAELRRQRAVEVALALRVALLLQYELPQLEIAERLGVTLLGP